MKKGLNFKKIDLKKSESDNLDSYRVGVYCRISQEKTGQDRSIEDQKLLGLEYCGKNRYSNTLYIDEGYSGTIENRPAFQDLLADISEGKIDMVWVYDDSRLQRSPEIRYLILDLFKSKGVKYCTYLEGVIDLENPESNLMGGIMAEFNKYFVAITKIKVTGALRRRTQKGLGFGSPAYGYRLKEDGFYEIIPEEAEIIKIIYELSLQGVGIDKIAFLLNEDNIKTKYNKYEGVIRLDKSKGKEHERVKEKKDIKWSGKTIGGILNNTQYYGKKKVKDEFIDVPPIFDISYWEKVNHNFKNNNKTKNHDGGIVKYDYLLNGLIRCGKCGKNYNGRTRADKKDHHYYCMSKRYKGENCGNRSINIDKIENFIWDTLFINNNISQAIMEEIGSSSTRKQCESEIDKIRQNIDVENEGKNNILKGVKSGAFQIEEVEEDMKLIRNNIKQYETKIKLLKDRISSLNDDDVIELFENEDYFIGLSFEHKRRLVEKYIEVIDVFWVDEVLDGVRIRYYKLIINYKVGGIKEMYTNWYGLDLDKWSKVEYDEMNDIIHFSRANSTAIEDLFNKVVVDTYPNHLTLAPNEETQEEDDIIKFYGAKKYKKLKAELRHKLNSNVFRVSL